jgi:hypothetical protein
LSWCLLLELETLEKITATIPFGCCNPLSSMLSSSFFLLSSYLSLFFSFSCILINEDSAVSCCVVSLWLPYAMHILDVSNLLNFEKKNLSCRPWRWCCLVYASYLDVPCLKNFFGPSCLLFSRLFLSRNLSLIFSSAIIIFSTTRLYSSLFLGFSLQKS